MGKFAVLYLDQKEVSAFQRGLDKKAQALVWRETARLRCDSLSGGGVQRHSRTPCQLGESAALGGEEAEMLQGAAASSAQVIQGCCVAGARQQSPASASQLGSGPAPGRKRLKR